MKTRALFQRLVGRTYADERKIVIYQRAYTQTGEVLRDRTENPRSRRRHNVLEKGKLGVTEERLVMDKRMNGTAGILSVRQIAERVKGII
jgi:hypothetical protein